MDIKLAVPGIIAAAVLLPGALPGSALALEPETAHNTTSPTPGDASVPTNASGTIDDTRVTQQIREAMLTDPSLSPDVSYAVTVATNAEAVILVGAVSSADKKRVEALAEQLAGARQVVNQLTIRDF